MSSRTWVTVVPVTTVFSTAASACELRPSRRASILVDADAHLARRLHPVEIDVPRVRVGRHDACASRKRDVAHLRRRPGR